MRPARLWRQWLWLALSLGSLVLWWSLPGQLQRGNAWLQDWATRWHARAAAPEVVLVLVDEPSIAAIGRWPWRRALHAQLVRHIDAGQPQSIALDLLFTEEDLDYPQDDLLLAQALAERDAQRTAPASHRPTVSPAPRIWTPASDVPARDFSIAGLLARRTPAGPASRLHPAHRSPPQPEVSHDSGGFTKGDKPC